MNFICRKCRATHDGDYRESCPACLAEFSLARMGYRRASKPLAAPEAKPLVIQRDGSFDQLVETEPFEGLRASTGFMTLDAILGRNDTGRYVGQSGISRQGVYLISGEGGLGKTALLYEWLARFRRDGIRCAFISSEQQASAIRAAIIRLGLDDDLRTMNVLCTKDFGVMMGKVVEADIEIVVIDSLNEFSDPDDKTKSEEAKVNMLNRLIADAWRSEDKPRAWLVIVQMNAGGEIRGSEKLIHNSDAQLVLRRGGLGDLQIVAELPKNRFGVSKGPGALFRMNDKGKMVEIIPGGTRTPPAATPPPIPVVPMATLDQQSTDASPPASDVVDAEPPTSPAPPMETAAPTRSAQPDSDFRPADDSPASGPPFKTETPLVAAARALNDGRAFEGLLATTRRRREARERGHE